jgi:hypothetical protein
MDYHKPITTHEELLREIRKLVLLGAPREDEMDRVENKDFKVLRLEWAKDLSYFQLLHRFSLFDRVSRDLSKSESSVKVLTVDYRLALSHGQSCPNMLTLKKKVGVGRFNLTMQAGNDGKSHHHFPLLGV